MKKKIVMLAVVCVLLIMAVTTFFGNKGVMSLRGDRKKLAAQAARIRDLEAQKARLEAEIARLASDPRAVEKAAREKLGLAAPGEKVVVDPVPSVKK